MSHIEQLHSDLTAALLAMMNVSSGRVFTQQEREQATVSVSYDSLHRLLIYAGEKLEEDGAFK